MEPLTTALGFSVGKAVFKAWFKDNEFASSLSESATDFFKGAVTERKAKSAADRQLGRIAENAAEALETYIRFEWGELEEYEKIEAINVVQNCIDEVGINARLMAALDFSAERLVALLTDKLEINGLSESARPLALTLASEAAQMISDLASSLPEFHRDTYAEVLKREIEIMEKLDRVFQEIATVRHVANKEGDAADNLFEQSYRRSIARVLDKIELYGLDSGIKQSSRQHSLSTAYISLSVGTVHDATLNGDDGEGYETSVSQPTGPLGPSIRAEEAANLSKYVVIKGEAGSGKTTLLQALAVRCATLAYDGEMEDWNDLIPFFVRLRALSNLNLPSPEELPSLSAPMRSGTMPFGWVHKQLERGRGLILVDGLDEISDDKRAATRRWIEDLLAEYPDNRVVVTSRPTAIPDDWLAATGFKQLELAAMSPSDVETFVDHWHHAVANEEQDLDKRHLVAALPPQLKERIKADRALRELAATPLLCAMLCAMNRDRKQVLPTNRIALLEAAVQMMVHGRDEERQIRVESLVPLDYETKLSLLREIAFWMMQTGSSMADDWRIEDFVSSILPSFTKLMVNITAKDVLRSLILRSGVIRSPVDGKVDFVHNAFKEFLSAKAVVSGDRLQYLEGALSSEAWREVAVLAAAMADERRRAIFIEALLGRGDNANDAGNMYHLLAVRCLETCTELDPVLQGEIRSRLSKMAAPSSFTEARSLSAAGDLALPLLKQSPAHYARTAASCVRALRQIGTADALAHLKDYASDRRTTVSREVIGAWPFFDAEQFASEILPKSRGISGTIRLDQVDRLKYIRYCTSTPGLWIALRAEEVSDHYIQEIVKLRQLHRLSLAVKGTIDVERLRPLNRLTFLQLSADIIQNLNTVSKFSSLNRLMVGGKSSGLDFASLPKSILSLSIYSAEIPLGGSPQSGSFLNEISIINDQSSTDLWELEKFLHLRSASIANIATNIDLRAIGKISRLRTLKFQNIRSLGNLDGLESLENLVELQINRALELRDIDALCQMKNLRNLTIKGAPSLMHLDAIGALLNLDTLTLDVDDQADFSFISDLPKLRFVSVTTKNFEAIKRQGLTLDSGVFVRGNLRPTTFSHAR